jgi:hypothetical protein
MPISIAIAFLLILLCACTDNSASYTSQDLARLPCETRGQFFYPVEFDKEGTLIYKDQWAELQHAIMQGSIRDVFVFVHGWDKTAKLAEKDYQDFVCRFYAHGSANRAASSDSLEPAGSSLLIGLFWPSTVFPNSSDLALIKPATYHVIRRRADTLAGSGFQKVMALLQELLLSDTALQGIRLHFIGHSFGARVIVKGFYIFFDRSIADPNAWLFFGNKINIILLLPAVSADTLTSKPLPFDIDATEAVKDPVVQSIASGRLSKALESKKIGTLSMLLLELNEKEQRFYREELERLKTIEKKMNARLDSEAPKSLSDYATLSSKIHVFAVYSSNDYANRFLFPIGSLLAPLSSDKVACALGGCGAPGFPSMIADNTGKLLGADILEERQVVNIDASSLIYSHSDIYKGRVAKLLWDIINHAKPMSVAQISTRIRLLDDAAKTAETNRATLLDINQIHIPGFFRFRDAHNRDDQ